MSGKPNRLINIITKEVSFVDKAANKKKFLLTKAANDDDKSFDNEKDMEEISMKESILKAAGEVEVDNDAITSVATAAELDAETVVSVLQVLKAAELPTDFYPQLFELADIEMPVKEVEKIVEVEKQSDEDKAEALRKEALASLPAEQREVIEKSLTMTQELEKRAAAIEAELAKEKEEKTRQTFIAKAEKEYPSLPEKAEVVGDILMKAAKSLSVDEVKVLDRLMKAANDAIESREDFDAVGSVGSGEAGTAYEKVLAAANELRKSDSSLSIAKAIGLVAIKDPDLYAAYKREEN